MQWNPNATGTVGLEWFPHTESSVTLDALTKCVCQSILQTTSQTIGVIRVPVTSLPTRGGMYAVEVYDNETGIPTDSPSILLAQPNEDVTLNGWTEDDGTTATIYDQIDETIIDITDYIRSPLNSTLPDPFIGSGGTPYIFRMNTGGLSLTGKRILSCRPVVWCKATSGAVPVQLAMNIGGVSALVASGIVGTTLAGIYPSDPLTYNPATGKAWTIADVQAFDTSDEIELYALTTGGSQRLYCYIAWLEIITCTENRIAVGYLDDTSSGLSANAWNSATMVTPTGGAWTKDGSGRHLYTVRRTNGTGRAVIPTLAGAAKPNAVSGFSPTLDPTYGYLATMGAATPTIFGLIQRTTAPAESVDSQPYADLLPALVYTGRVAEQEFSNEATANYKRVQTLVKSNDATASLLVKVKNRSGGAQVGGTLTLTKAAVDALADAGSGWRAIDDVLASQAALTSGGQYYLEFSSTAAGTGTDYWSVVGLDTLDQGNGATFQGTTDRGTINGSEADRYELAVTLATAPTAPSNFAVALAIQTLAATIRGTTAFKYCHCTWTATALGGSFLRYELERSEDGGTTYVRVATIALEATVAFDDYESKRGTAVQYRLRVIRSDGSASDWVTAGPVTPTVTATEIALVSNDDPTLNVLVESPTAINYDFLAADDVVFHKIYGRDHHVAFTPTEDRGVRFPLDVILHAGGPAPSSQGIAKFDAIRAICAADLDYVCVHEHHGNRWFAKVQCGAGKHRLTPMIYVAQLIVTSLTDTPDALAA